MSPENIEGVSCCANCEHFTPNCNVQGNKMHLCFANPPVPIVVTMPAMPTSDAIVVDPNQQSPNKMQIQFQTYWMRPAVQPNDKPCGHWVEASEA